MKKFLPLLFSTAIISGLLFSLNVEAFEYVAQWTSKIAFDKNHFKYVDSIVYWNSTKNLDECYDDGQSGKECELTREDDNEYTINVNFKSTGGATIDTVYLNRSNNIKKIIN